MPFWMFVRLQAAAGQLLTGVGHACRRGGPSGAGGPGAGGLGPAGPRALGLGAEGGFSTAEGLAGAALAVVALIAIWAAMRAFGLDIVRWMQDQITSQG
jgi:hypothetical protein